MYGVTYVSQNLGSENFAVDFCQQACGLADLHSKKARIEVFVLITAKFAQPNLSKCFTTKVLCYTVDTSKCKNTLKARI